MGVPMPASGVPVPELPTPPIGVDEPPPLLKDVGMWRTGPVGAQLGTNKKAGDSECETIHFAGLRCFDM